MTAAASSVRAPLLGMLACIAMLALMGLFAGVSAAVPGSSFERLSLHALHLAAGVAAFLLFFRVAPEFFRKILPLLLGVTILVLVAMVLVPGFAHESHAARRWLNFGGFVFQPSVLLQCLWPAWVASWAARDPLRLSQSPQLWRLMGAFALCMAPVLLQPDFGSVVILAVATTLVLFFAGAPLSFLRQLIILMIPVLFVGLFVFDHVDARLSGFFAAETTHQAVRAEEAFAAGGLTGMGPGEGLMKQGWVPEGETDYILSLIAEEWGLVGTGLVWGFYVAFTLLGLRVARRADCRYGAILMAAAVLMVSLQACLNMAVVTGLIPPKGLPLPFVSRGGTSILALSALLGLAARAVLVPRRSAVPVSDLIQWTESNALA